MRRASAIFSFCAGLSLVSSTPALRSFARRRSIASSNEDLGAFPMGRILQGNQIRQRLRACLGAEGQDIARDDAGSSKAGPVWRSGLTKTRTSDGAQMGMTRRTASVG